MDDKLKEKIAKLMKLGKSPNPNEAAAAVAKAMALADEAGLVLSEIDLDDEAIVRRDLLQTYAKIPTWIEELSSRLAITFCVRLINNYGYSSSAGGIRHRLQACGYPQDVEVYIYVLDQCANIAKRLTSDHMKTKRFRIERNRRKYRDSYIISASQQLAWKARILYQKHRDQQERQTQQQCTDIMLRKSSAVDRYIDRICGKNKREYQEPKLDRKAAEAGRYDAARAQLGRGITANHKQLNG